MDEDPEYRKLIRKLEEYESTPLQRPICAICNKPVEWYEFQPIIIPKWLKFSDPMRMRRENECALEVEISGVAKCHGKIVEITIFKQGLVVEQPFRKEAEAKEDEEKRIAREETDQIRRELDKEWERGKRLARSAYLFSSPAVREVE